MLQKEKKNLIIEIECKLCASQLHSLPNKIYYKKIAEFSYV